MSTLKTTKTALAKKLGVSRASLYYKPKKRITRKSCGAIESLFRQVNPLLFKEGDRIIHLHRIYD